MNHQPLDDLEMFELLQAAYPEKFQDDENATWDAAMEFTEEFGGFDALADLLGRVAMLAAPMASALSGKPAHCLGKVTVSNGKVFMNAAVKREVAA